MSPFLLNPPSLRFTKHRWAIKLRKQSSRHSLSDGCLAFACQTTHITHVFPCCAGQAGSLLCGLRRGV